MIRKKSLFVISLAAIFIILFSHISFATDTALNSAAPDNTLYTTNAQDNVSDTPQENNSQNPTLSYTEYDDSTDLSISNMINIVLAAIGVVLILLGIAILLKIK